MLKSLSFNKIISNKDIFKKCILSDTDIYISQFTDTDTETENILINRELFIDIIEIELEKLKVS